MFSKKNETKVKHNKLIQYHVLKITLASMQIHINKNNIAYV